MKIGVTGTRNGINQEQRDQINEYFDHLAVAFDEVHEIHHGDCVGADVEFAEMARQHPRIETTIVCHPPVIDDLRGYFPSDAVYVAKGYFERNRYIVDNVDVLIVLPEQLEPQKRGGTWYTYDYAKKRGVPVEVMYPVSNHIRDLMNQGR